jgi:hypothetical protein
LRFLKILEQNSQRFSMSYFPTLPTPSKAFTGKRLLLLKTGKAKWVIMSRDACFISF